MKLYEFVDRLYAMGDMESPKTVRSKKTLNESYTVSDELFDEYKSDDFKDVGDIHNEIMFNYGDKDLADDVVSRIEVYRNNRDDDDDLDEGLNEALFSDNELEEYIRKHLNPELSLADVEVYNSGNHAEVQVQLEPEIYNNDGYGYVFNYVPKETSVEDFFDYVVQSLNNVLLEEGLTEAANPENAEVNAVLRKWANSDRNRISKRDQKVLDDAGIKLKTNKYDAPHKYAVHKDNEGDILDLHRMDKRHIKNTHPDHDLANDLATTGRHWSNRDRYNKNKDPNFPWRNDAYREETPEESKALRPYSDEYKKQKRIADYERYLRGEGLTEDKDLSTVKGSMTKILQDNREKIDACGSAKEVHDTVAGLLAEAGLDTQATRRLLLTLKKQRGLTGALQAVYNSILKGSDLGVIKEAANTNPSRYRVKGCNKNGRVENHDQFMIFDSEYNDEIDYYDLCEIIRDVNEDNDLSSSQVEDIATDVISELYFQTPDEDLGEIISMYSY